MSIDLDYLDEDDQWQTLLPCSSGYTVVGLAADPPISRSVSQFSHHPQLTIILPNLIDRISVSMSDVQLFVEDTTATPCEITMTHFLIYLLLQSTDSSVTCINNLRILHMGRQYSVLLLKDLTKPLPALAEVAAKSCSFQLVVPTSLQSTPITLTIPNLILKTTETSTELDSGAPVTYADSMVRIFRKALRRKLSVSSALSRRSSGPTRTALNGSSTDVEEIDLGQAKPKQRLSWKRVFRRNKVSH